MNKPQNSFPQQMFIKDKIVTSPQELAEEMNEYFVEEISSIKENPAQNADTESALMKLREVMTKKKKEST